MKKNRQSGFPGLFLLNMRLWEQVLLHTAKIQLQ